MLDEKGLFDYRLTLVFIMHTFVQANGPSLQWAARVRTNTPLFSRK